MERIAFLLKLTNEDHALSTEAVADMKAGFEKACAEYGVGNFSLWRMESYLFGYGESEMGNAHAFDAALNDLPKGVTLICVPGSMPLMYHDFGIVREDKRLIRHRVFAARLKPGCAAEYKRRHDDLIAKRGDSVSDGPESNFTIWLGDGCIFGYCELVKTFDAIEPRDEQKAESKAWELRQLEIMDWLTDDMDWLTGEKHAPSVRVL